MPFVFLNDILLPEDEAQISITDRGFLFGDGVFETVAVHDSIPYQWELHQQRMQDGLAALGIDYNQENHFKNALLLIEKNKLINGALRIYINRGSGSRGYLPTGKSPTILVQTFPFPPPPPESIGLWQSGIEKISAKALPVQCKLAQGVNSTLVRMEAQKHDCFEALQLNAEGNICEGSSANIFWVTNGKLHTPSLDCGLLAGTTRAAILRLQPLPVVEGHYTLSALEGAECVFLTNTAWKILPVNQLEPQGWQFDPEHPAIALCRDALNKDIADYVAAAGN